MADVTAPKTAAICVAIAEGPRLLGSITKRINVMTPLGALYTQSCEALIPTDTHKDDRALVRIMGYGET
jgi:hypothetical protein